MKSEKPIHWQLCWLIGELENRKFVSISSQISIIYKTSEWAIQNYINVYVEFSVNCTSNSRDRRKSIYNIAVSADITKSPIRRSSRELKSDRETPESDVREKRSCERYYWDTLYNGPSESPSVNLSRRKTSWRTRRRYSAGDKSSMNRERESVGPTSLGSKSRAIWKEKETIAVIA